MSRILRRPMFRGGRVDSYGTGIASGLGYAKGGRVGYNVAGLVSPGMATEYARGQGTIKSGGGILDAAKGKIYSRPIGPPAPGFFDKLRAIPYLGRAVPFLTGATGTFGGAALGGIGLGKAVDFYAKSTSTPEEYKRRKEMSSIPFMFDETNLDVGEAFKYIDEGSKIGEAPGFFPRGGKEKFFKDKGLDPNTGLPIEDTDFEVSGEAAKVDPGKTAVDAIFAAGETRAANKQKTEKLLSDDTILKNQNTANEELTLEEIKQTLGADKAFKRDLEDMGTRLSASLIGAPSVKEGFAEFLDRESRTGPSRSEKIETAAATFLLKEKAATKRDKAKINQFKEQIRFQIAEGDKVSLPKSLLAANKSGTMNNREIAVGIQGATSDITGQKYKFKKTVKQDQLAKELETAKPGDTFIVEYKVKDSTTGAEKTLKSIIEVDLNGEPQRIYNL